MRKIIATAFLSTFACLGSLFAQMPTTIAVEEISTGGDERLGPYSKLLSEYVITELSACNLVKVVSFDAVSKAKADLKIGDLKQATPKEIDNILKKVKADAMCLGVLKRVDGKSASVEISVYKNGALQARIAKSTMRTIEDSDSAAQSLADQIANIVNGSEKGAGDPSLSALPAAPTAAAAVDSQAGK